MTEQSPSAIGTVAQEAARLIEDMVTMARSSYTRDDDASAYTGAPAEEPVSPDAADATHAPYAAGPAEDSRAGGSEATDEPSEGACSQCGAHRDDSLGHDIPSSCRLCPLCRGIALLRSVRPETVDLLADLAVSLAAGLRDVAMRSRASDPAPSARPTSRRPPDADRVAVQDILVDDESEG